MLGLYYRIWVDFITRAKRNPANNGNWQKGSMIFMTLAMSSNLILIMTILERHVLPERANSVLSYIFLFILPCLVINYQLTFRNKRYLKLLERYPYYNGKLAISYFVISMVLPIALLLFGSIFFR